MSPAHDKRRMIECMDSLARRDIIEINNSDKKQEDERRKKNVDQMMYPNLTTHTASKRNNDEEFELMEAYCNFSKSVDTNDRSRYKNIEHSYEGNGYDRKRAAAQSLPQSPQISLTQGQQKRNAFPHPQRILVPYPQPPIRSKSNLSSDIHSEPESDLENNLDIDSPDETDSDNDISYVGHYADSSASRYSGNAMDREGMSEIGRDLSYISSREMQRLDKEDLRTDRDNCYSSNDDYVEANNLIYSSYGDDISIGINTWDSKPKEGCHQESTQYTMVENPLHRDNTNRDVAGERETNRHLFGRRRGVVEGHVSTSGTGLHTQNEDSGEVQDDSKDSKCSLIPLAQTAAVAVEKSNIRDREEELYKLMGISYGSTPQSPPLSSSLSHRSSPLRRSLSNTNQISSPYRNPLCPRRGTDYYRGADLMRSNNLEINATQSTLMHMQSSISQKEAAGALESSWESKLKSNEQRAGTGTKQYHSLPRIKLLCGWLSSLNIWDRDIEPSTLHTELRSGLFLIRLVQTLDPSAVFLSVNVKVHSARPALENLENVLGHVMRTKKVNKNK